MMLKSSGEVFYGHSQAPTQEELVEKFNAAFYDAQNHLGHQLSEDDVHENGAESFATFFNGVENDYDDNFLIDFLISKSETASTPTVTTEDTATAFDYNEFARSFDDNLSKSGDKDDGDNYVDYTYLQHYQDTSQYSQFYVPPPSFTNSPPEEVFDNIDVIYDLCDTLSSGSFEFDFHELQDLPQHTQTDSDTTTFFTTKLPPVTTLTRNNMDFSSFLRNTPADDLDIFSEDAKTPGNFGHLLGGTQKSLNNNLSLNQFEPIYNSDISENNHVIMTQNEALLHDDPLLSSSSVFPQLLRPEVYAEEADSEPEEITAPLTLQCKWENCYQLYETQSALVRHIEKCHVELKRGEEFTCFWFNCPRKTKPFNARYKLLIHMRVHSGEKPNKCPFKGCNKAFSRLENLKIHQRSHTGERPYLCQFANCTKSFSNSSDRAKHQRTHFDTKPYACQVFGCTKKYTDPSSLRKHVKNHSFDEQAQLKKKSHEREALEISIAKKSPVRKQSFDSNEHSYNKQYVVYNISSSSVKQDLKNKISEKNRKRCDLH